jgi:hypothetical protein
MAAQIDDAFILRWMRRLNADPTKHCFGDLNDCDRERKLLHATVLVAHNLVLEGSQDATRIRAAHWICGYRCWDRCNYRFTSFAKAR